MRGAKAGRSGLGDRRVLLGARVVLTVAAAVLVAVFFLPWASADAEYREAVAQMPDAWYVEGAGLSVSDAEDLSLMEYAHVYGMAEDLGLSNLFEIYAPITYAGLACAGLSLLCAVLGKAIPSGVFGLLGCGVLCALRWDFSDRGVLPNGTHDWGVASELFVPAAAVLVVAAVVLAVAKHRTKAQMSAQGKGKGEAR